MVRGKGAVGVMNGRKEFRGRFVYNRRDVEASISGCALKVTDMDLKNFR